MTTHSQTDDIDVYIFTLDGERDFWVPAGGKYAHFALVDDVYRFIRLRETLPGRALGYAVKMKAVSFHRLSDEAARHGLALTLRAQPGPEEQYVFDRAVPAGVLTLDGFAFLGD